MTPRNWQLKLWATAHGLACLAMNHQLEKFLPDVDIYRLLESSTQTFLKGLKSPCESMTVSRHLCTLTPLKKALTIMR